LVGFRLPLVWASFGHVDIVATSHDYAPLWAAVKIPESAFQPPTGVTPALVSMQREFPAKQIEEHWAKIAWRSSEALRKGPSALPPVPRLIERLADS
jgi:hypothetical protein